LCSKRETLRRKKIKNMEDKWRIYFTALILGTIVTFYIFIGIFNVVFALMFFSGYYIFVGFLTCLICCDLIPNIGVFFKLLIAWLPALWIDKIRDWVTK
jgi:hypothetical protein